MTDGRGDAQDNLALIFVRSADFVDVASLPNINPAFQLSDESDEQYRQRMADNAKSGRLLSQLTKDRNRIIYSAI